MSLILNIETGTDICSVALGRDGRLVVLRESGGRNHARELAPFVQQVVAEAGVSLRELSAVAVGRGPGSYTGLRVGTSLAKGLAYGLGIPLIGIDSLAALAAVAVSEVAAGIHSDSLDGTLRGAVLAPMIDARRMEVYTRRFDATLNPLSETGALILHEHTFADLLDSTRVVAFGDGAAKLDAVLAHPNLVRLPVLPSARGMVALAEEAFVRRDFVDTAYFEPFYLKDFVVIPSKKSLIGRSDP